MTPTQTAKKQEQRVNGVDLVGLHDTIKAVRENPTLGKARFSATNTWKGQALNETEIGTFFCAGEEHTHKKRLVLQNDEAHVLLGEDDAPNPVEFILHALAGCVTTTTVYHAAALGIRIQELETTLEGDLDLQGMLQTDPTVPCGYQNIRVGMRIKSDADGEKLEKLKTLFRFSPVFETLTRAVEVDVTVNM
jgi:uncharacterized OsmC-like protein